MSGHMKGGRGRPPRHEEEEHENHERWLVTYADMLTLLMVLFIVLFAISQVDQKKFAALKEGLAVGFGAQSAAFTDPGAGVKEADNEGSPMDLQVGTGGSPDAKVEDEALKKAVQAADRAKEQQRQEEAKKEVQNLEQIRQKILEALRASGQEDSVRFAIDERGLIVTIVTTSVVFAGNKADLLPGGQQILNAIGPAIVDLPNRIEVDGHTNQLNVPTAEYPSGWELSSARASTVVRYLHARMGIPESRLVAVGFADTRPLYDPADPRAAALNRRVEIVVLTTVPGSISSLLPSAVGSDSTAAGGSENQTEAGG
ncbi:MAG: flagellar motor protein MotB [Micromonosporaceae bacterium]|nr:flagellar motor protein MotB [Micromonosporaceae bacterium]